jgi:hypothetical protein
MIKMIKTFKKTRVPLFVRRKFQLEINQKKIEKVFLKFKE